MEPPRKRCRRAAADRASWFSSAWPSRSARHRSVRRGRTRGAAMRSLSLTRPRWLAVLSLAILLAASRVAAQATDEEAQQSAETEADKLAQLLANPVSNLWSVQFQFNNFELTNDRWNYNLNFQPVMPVSLTNCVNLITRPVVQVYNSVPYTDSFGNEQRTTNFGDWTQLELLSPCDTGNVDTGLWILGGGPTFILPTAGSVYTGQGKWQVGPAVVVGYMTKKFVLGVFPQQWWSYAGDENRPNTSQMNLQPIFSLFFDGGWNVGYSGNILADWRQPSNNRWTVPIGLFAGKVVKFGRLPVKIALAGQYMVTQPDPVGQKWNIQIVITPVLPKLIQGTLF